MPDAQELNSLRSCVTWPPMPAAAKAANMFACIIRRIEHVTQWEIAQPYSNMTRNKVLQ